jgi:hypothetical protein
MRQLVDRSGLSLQSAPAAQAISFYWRGEHVSTIKKLAFACLGSAAVVAAGAGPASAGETNGNQVPIPAPQHANSICVYSGLNYFGEETEPGRTQSYGQIVAAGGKNFAPSPGFACNAHRFPLRQGVYPTE